RLNRYIALVGLAGNGKSTLAAALAHPNVTAGIVPDASVQAVAFISDGTAPRELAADLAKQLAVSVPGFKAARNSFLSKVNPEELARLDSLQRELLGPLRCLDRDKKIRIVLDGLDRLSIGAALPTIATVNALVSDADFSNVSLVVTARPDFPLPGA